MKIRIIDFGLPENHRPLRSHANDAGADVYMPFDCTLEPGGIAKIPLGFAWRCRTAMLPMCSQGAALRHKGWSVSCPLWILATGAKSMPLSAMWEMMLKCLRKIPGSDSLSSCLW